MFPAEALRDLLPHSEPLEELPALVASGSFPSDPLAAKNWPQTSTPFPPGKQTPHCVSCNPAPAARPGKRRDMSSSCVPPPPPLLLHQPPQQLVQRHQKSPLPEVSSADVGHFGAAHGAGLDEVLGGQHDGFDASLHRQLVVLH